MRCFVIVLLTILSVLSSQRAVASPAHCFLRWELRLARRWRELRRGEAYCFLLAALGDVGVGPEVSEHLQI